MKKIIAITTDGDSREDGNVYYSNYILVESSTLNFDEPIFTDPEYGPRNYITDEDVSEDNRMNQVVDEIRKLGYTVEEFETQFIEILN
jgi:hypothetical protein